MEQKTVPLSEKLERLRVPSWLEPVALVGFDVVATFVALYLAAWGVDAWMAALGTTGVPLAVGLLAIINVIVFACFHMYTSLWRYASISEALRIFLATVCGSVVGAVVLTFVLGHGIGPRRFVMSWALLFIMVAASRMGIRALFGVQSWRFPGSSRTNAPRTLVVGAGETGSLTIKRMLADEDDCMRGDPVALVDDDPDKVGHRIHGVKVHGTCDDIPKVAADCEASQVVFACPSATAAQRKRILDLCMQTGLKVLTLPDVRDIPTDQIGRISLRDVEISDLLSRDEIQLDLNQVDYITDKCVLVTGGGGSIGSEIVRQLISAHPAKVVLFDIYENTTYELVHEISAPASKQGIAVCPEIGSIANEEAIRLCFERHRPDVVFHAAAHKHVPLMENNAREAIENNVFGTQIVARLADEFGCSHFILISTDKAVNPTNVMGATKRMCEMDIQYFAQTSETVFAAVRFGNVLGSHGSVIPLFRRQLKEGGPITLTHPDVTRYFMTIPEASRLVITAGALARGGEIFILKMGEPVRIADLAENLIRLSGLRLGRDIEVEITGLRPGEKLFEELQMDDEEPIETTCDDIMVSAGKPLPKEEISRRMMTLKASLKLENDDIKRALAKAVPTYKPEFGSSS